ncbi:MAG: 4Fe-4S ferredoxin [Desulfovibrio sp.]|nr:4Fe-4S ferredoxin [Desulfovibrio sp.]
MPSRLEELKDAIRKALPDLDMVLAWGQGPDSLRRKPLFIVSQTDIDKIVWDPCCSPNLAGYLTGLRGKKVGIVVKGCDCRSVVELIQEKLVDRAEVTIFGLHCEGTITPAKVRAALPGDARGAFGDCRLSDGQIRFAPDTPLQNLAASDALYDKCLRCAEPNAGLCDYFIGERGTPPPVSTAPPDTLERLGAMSLEERFRFWEQAMDRCVRCYACRNACPLCVCKDHCLAQSRDPHWLDQTDHPREKLMFQVIHALHTAGRCVECGECERACPMGLPVMALKRALNRQISELFDYRAGLDPEAIPPLFTFREEEDRIGEKKWL